MMKYLAIALLLGAGILVGCKKAEEPAAAPAAPSEPAAPAETPPAEQPAQQ